MMSKYLDFVLQKTHLRAKRWKRGDILGKAGIEFDFADIID